MSLVTAIRFGLGFLDLLIGLLVVEYHYQSIALHNLIEDHNKDRNELNDIKERVKKYECKSK